MANKKNKNISYSKKDYKKFLPLTNINANKYSRGVSFIAAGSKNYPGAAILASRASQRVGAGYTKLFTISANVARSAFAMPSCPVSGFTEFSNDQLKKVIANRPHAFLIGSGFIPGGSYNPARLKTALKLMDSPIVIDGGALSCFTNKEVRDLLSKRKGVSATILTPHMGEAMKILKAYKYNDDISSPKKIAKKINKLTGAIVVLKGQDTYVYDNNKCNLITNGGPELAKAGSGDVLAGMIVGLVCQNQLSVFKACSLAVYLHALAGKYYVNKYCIDSLIPEDLIDCIPQAINQLKA